MNYVQTKEYMHLMQTILVWEDNEFFRQTDFPRCTIQSPSINVCELQSVIIWKAFEEQKFGHLLIGDKLNLAVEVLDAIPEKSASDSAWDLVVGCNIDRILFTILLIRLCGVCLWPGELGASSLTKGFWAVRIRNSWQAKRGEGMHGFYNHLRFN